MLPAWLLIIICIVCPLISVLFSAYLLYEVNKEDYIVDKHHEQDV